MTDVIIVCDKCKIEIDTVSIDPMDDEVEIFIETCPICLDCAEGDGYHDGINDAEFAVKDALDKL